MSAAPDPPDPRQPSDPAGDRAPTPPRWPLVHPAGSAPWIEAALQGATLLQTTMCGEVEHVMRCMVCDPRRASLLSDEIHNQNELGPLIAMGRGPALLAAIVEAGQRVLLESFPRERVLAAPRPPPPRRRAGGLELERPSAEDKAAARALVELARVRAVHDLAAGLMILDDLSDPHALDHLDDEALDRLDPDRPPDPATLDLPDPSGKVTELDVTVVLGVRAYRGEDLFGVLYEFAALYAAQVAELAPDRPSPGYHYPGW